MAQSARTPMEGIPRAMLNRFDSPHRGADASRCNNLRLRARMHPTRTPTVGTTIRFYVQPRSCIVFPK